MQRIRLAGKATLSTLPLLDRWFRRLIWSRLHFPEFEMVALNRLNSGSIDIAVDIGAARGGYCWVLEGKSKTVYAFEPGDVHYQDLESTCLLSNVVPVKAAVSDVGGTASLYTPGDDSDARHTASLELSGASPTQAKTKTTIVQTISLDEFFGSPQFQNRSVDFIKVDVEGHEYKALVGAQKILSKNFPVVLCEIEVRHNPTYDEAFSFMRSLGYEVFYYQGTELQQLQGVEIASLQLMRDLDDRLSGRIPSHANRYINNFIFIHKNSKMRWPT